MANHLKNERSLYLRLHADDPVDWYPWGREAFEKARRENRPVFLSIGYATCHWCHVMAKDAFSDAEIAALLNSAFVAVKVDREERPDVDAVYMRACTALNGTGGWPLTVLATPDGEPFFAATFLPSRSRGRQMGLLPLLRAVSDKWKRDPDSLSGTAAEVTALLRREAAPSSARPDEALLREAVGVLLAASDSEYGGFGSAPKFPVPHQLLFLLRYAALSGDRKARETVELALRQMYRGGIFDHIGGGFCRYSTDREWLVPHFEKTLGDNALLALCCAEAWEDGHFPLYRRIAESTLDYCLRELRDGSGGFYSGQDADSDGEEGRYYLFTPRELREVLGEDEGRHFAECYDVTEEGNFRGKSIPNLLLNQRWSFVPEGYAAHREKLLRYRARRSALRTDDKLLTGANGLMLCALSRAARLFGSERYAACAEELAAFLLGTAGAQDPAAMRAVCYGETPSDLPALLDDYVFTALGFLELYRLRYDPACIARALALASELPARFADPAGGFFLTPSDSGPLPVRPKPVHDGALPSGNGAAAVLFDMLARITGEASLRAAADRQLEALVSLAGDAPAGIASGLIALLSSLYPTRELVCAAAEPPALLEKITGSYAPELTVLLRRPDDGVLPALCPWTADCAMRDGKPCFYVCRDGKCGLPFTE